MVALNVITSHADFVSGHRKFSAIIVLFCTRYAWWWKININEAHETLFFGTCGATVKS